MSLVTWLDEVRDHAARQRLGELRARLKELDAPPEYADALGHIREVVACADERLEATDFSLQSVSALNSIETAAAGTVEALANFVAQDQSAYIEQAVTNADGILSAIATLPTPIPDKQVKAALDKAREVRKEADDSQKQLRRNINKVGEEAGKVRALIAENRQAAEADVAPLKAELDQLKEKIGEESGRLDSALTAFDAQTTTALTNLQEEFSTAEATRAKDATDAQAAALKAFETQGQETGTRFEARAVEVIGRLEALRDQAAELVGVVTGTATAGHFKIVADGEKKIADGWRYAAVAFAAAAVGVGIWIVAAHSGDTRFEWGRFTAKAFLTVPLGGLAAYAGNQSAGHRRMERQARTTQLQLAALEPFLEPLDTDERDKIRAAFAEHLFRAVDIPAEDAGALNSGAVARALLEQVLSQAKK